MSRYFLHQWPKLCYLAYDGDTPFGTVVCKMDLHRDHMRGYVAMLVVDKAYRGKGAGKSEHLWCVAMLTAGFALRRIIWLTAAAIGMQGLNW